ncbi:MAG: hypothetical protein R3C39_12565 [Dehalococcoidia bacterium]
MTIDEVAVADDEGFVGLDNREDAFDELCRLEPLLVAALRALGDPRALGDRGLRRTRR